MSTLTKVHIRWMIRHDMPEVLAIEAASFEYPWCEDGFLRVLSQTNAIGMIAELATEQVVGFMIYELHRRDKIVLLDFAVHPQFRRQGIGWQLAEKLTSKLSTNRLNRVVIHIRESNLAGQLFLRQCGFLATQVDRIAYEDSGEDAYVMGYSLLEAE